MSKTSLNGTWKLSWQDITESAAFKSRPAEGSIDIQIPGDVHLALLEAGVIEDPIIGDNHLKCRWVGEKEWWLENSFKLSLTAEKKYFINFEGLDLVADIWLNGTHLASQENSFIALRKDITRFLNEGENSLAVRLLSHISESELPDSSDLSSNCAFSNEIGKYRPWMRKPQYSFGWDWTQGLYTCGIWRDVFIEEIESAEIEAPFAYNSPDTTSELAELTFECNTLSYLRETVNADLSIELCEKDNPEKCIAVFTKKIWMAPGKSFHTFNEKLSDPKLWWPYGHGEQNQYIAKFTVKCEDSEITSKSIDFGIRTIEIDEGPRQKEGASRFRFIINGKPIYLKGSNWVPADIILPRADSSRIKKLLELTVSGNQNYLRVWGGGVYEDKLFYQLCNEMGILVWQDFMFSCAEYPDYNEEFLNNINNEIPTAVCELRNNPCIIMWCGNNEIEQQVGGLGSIRPNGDYYGKSIFNKIIPDFLKDLDPSRPYRRSSGCRGINADPLECPTSKLSGVTHCSLGRYGEENNPEKIPSFANEWYAGGSPAVRKSLPEFMDTDNLDWNNPVWKMHSYISDNGAQVDFNRDMSEWFPEPEKLSFQQRADYYSLLMSETIKDRLEMLRANRWENSGSCFWMINDAYPGATWSVIDYYLREKPAYFAMKRAFAPLLPIARMIGSQLEIMVDNDSTEDIEGSARVRFVEFDGTELLSFNSECSAPANTLSEVFTVPESEISKIDRSRTFISVEICDNNSVIAENHFFAASLSDLKIAETEVSVTPLYEENKVTGIELEADYFIWNFSLFSKSVDLQLKDNFFDILPGEKKVIKLSEPVPLDDIEFDWENKTARDYPALTIPRNNCTCTAGGSNTLSVEVFNSHQQPDEYKLDLTNIPDEWDIKIDKSRFELAPNEIAAVKVSITTPVSAASSPVKSFTIVLTGSGTTQSREVAVEIINPLNSAVIVDGESIFLEIENIAAFELSNLKAAVLSENTSADLLEKEISVPVISAGQLVREEISLKENIVPFSIESRISIADREVARYQSWIDAEPFAPGRKFKSKILNCEPIRSTPLQNREKPAVSKTECYLISAEAESDQLSCYNSPETDIYLFCSYNAEMLFLQAFCDGDKCYQPSAYEALHNGSCIELAVSCSDSLAWEGCLGKRNNENLLQLRRQYGEVVGKTGHCPELTILHNTENNQAYYSIAIPWHDIDTGFRPESGKKIKTSFVFNNHKCGYTLFDGIKGRKDPALYGEFILG
ncbi:MAG: glycosyl hydrolase 2 galactose-binding domain-containing protein [Planctomycetota bacterium]|jgi:beta-mannosidase